MGSRRYKGAIVESTVRWDTERHKGVYQETEVRRVTGRHGEVQGVQACERGLRQQTKYLIN